MGKANQRAAYMRGTSPAITFEGVTLGRETDKAVLVNFGEAGEHWIPLSQVSKMERSTDRGCDKIIMSEWIAKEKGLL